MFTLTCCVQTKQQDSMELGPDVVGPNSDPFFSLIQMETRFFFHPGNIFPLLKSRFADAVVTGDNLKSGEFWTSVLKLDMICLIVAHLFVDDMILSVIMHRIRREMLVLACTVLNIKATFKITKFDLFD